MIAAEVAARVQTLLLRAPHGPQVRHIVLTIPDVPGAGSRARVVLAERCCQPSFGARLPEGADTPLRSLGFSFAGLERLGLPLGYQQVFRVRAPAFAAGAATRTQARGESDAQRPAQPWPELEHERAHVLLTLFGTPCAVDQETTALTIRWRREFGATLADASLAARDGTRLGAPPGQQGEWVHFGYRDGISELRIDDEQPEPASLDPRRHEAGALLLGHLDDEATNLYALASAPDQVREFFHDSSFGMLRPMHQDTVDFEAYVARETEALSLRQGSRVSTAWIKAKLCGRWPSGRPLLPGQTREPVDGSWQMAPALAQDPRGAGCPFGSHVRRMTPAPDGGGRVLHRPMQRRSVPFGPADWDGRAADGQPRGLLGHFFAASIEDQLEHPLGQWAARTPLGFDPEDTAQDPLLGPHESPRAALLLPQDGHPDQKLTGLHPWTRTLGTMYAWYPGEPALQALLACDFAPEDAEGPWR